MKELARRFSLVFLLLFAFISPEDAFASTAQQNAVKSGDALLVKLNAFEKAISSGDIVTIDKQYDSFTLHLKDTEILIGKVAGASARKGLINKYITPSKIAKERTIYEVSQYRLMNRIQAMINQGKKAESEENLAVLNRLKRRAEEIKRDGGYQPLPKKVNDSLKSQEAKLRQDFNNIGSDVNAKSGIVTASVLNVRSDRTTNSTIVGKLSQGARVEVLSVNGEWGLILFNGKNAYVHMSYIQLENGQTKPPSNDKILTGKKITIDPGHGGHDSGAAKFGLKEKDIVLSVGLLVQKRLEQAGATVIMTRSNDTYLTLAERSQIAHRANADIFVSIHINSSDKESPEGTETYWNDKHASKESRELAQSIQKRLIEKLKSKDRGVKEGNFAVIRDTKVPSVLLELGFISNKEEANKLNSASYQKDITEAVYLGIVDYYTN